MAESLQALLEGQIGAPYQRFSLADRALHAGLVERVRSPLDLAVDSRANGNGAWTVSLAAADAPGVLSMIAGLLTAFRLNIVKADCFTCHLPALPRPQLRGRAPVAVRPSRMLLDSFEVTVQGASAPVLMEAFTHELEVLIGKVAKGQVEAAREQVIERMTPAIEEAGRRQPNLLPLDLDVSNPPGAAATELVVHSADTPGFLFAFANALSLLDLNIERAEIRTAPASEAQAAGEIQDRFWLTDLRGQRLRGKQRLQELRVVTALVKQFTFLLPEAANPAQALRQFQRFTRELLARPNWAAQLRDVEAGSVLSVLARMLGVSEFLWEDFLRLQHENLFPVLRDGPALARPAEKGELARRLAVELGRARTSAARKKALNAFKDREMFRIDLRHITRGTDFEQFSAELSDLVEVVLGEACRLAEVELHKLDGVPRLASGAACEWALCALGKFGGRELGFASDIELLVIYAGDGQTSKGHLDNRAFFEQLVRGLQNLLAVRREGIFQVDLRLRPWGKDGPLAASLAGFQEYYSPAGAAAQYERMALVKLRPVAGGELLAEQVLNARDAFVYSSQPLAVENIRHLRHRQATELVPPGAVNAKYSPGGLVDIEYYVQACQIEGGGRRPALRTPNTLAAIAALANARRLTGAQAGEFRASYAFLRRLIDALRIVRGNAKDLTIPHAESREFGYLARRLRFDDPVRLQAEVLARMAAAKDVWEWPRRT